MTGPPKGREQVDRTAASVAPIAWGACATTLALASAAVVLAVLGRTGPSSLNIPVLGVSGALVGALVASRRPENPVGWLFLAGSLAGALQSLAGEYAVYGLISDPGSLPFARAGAWLSKSAQILGPVFVFVLVPLYFPNGRPPSPRWNLLAWVALGLLPPASALVAFSPGEAVYGTGIPNPLAVEALRPIADAIVPVLFVYYIGLIFAAAASLAVRLVRSHGEERQQIKWLAYAAALVPAWFVLNAPIERAFPALFGVVDSLVISAVPVAAGVAILRHRLYDIDLVINRTLVYGSLTAMLALVYFGGVAGLQRLLSPLMGEGNGAAVVASTLLIASLFGPLRRRVQGFIDRRFYRQKYDAARALGAFSERLRGEADLDDLGEDLARLLSATVQPAHASLWLRSAAEPEAEREG